MYLTFYNPFMPSALFYKEGRPQTATPLYFTTFQYFPITPSNTPPGFLKGYTTPQYLVQ